MERELLHKYFRGETSAEEEKQIMDWAEASPENHAVYLKERKIWNAMLLVPAIAGKPVRGEQASTSVPALDLCSSGRVFVGRRNQCFLFVFG